MRLVKVSVACKVLGMSNWRKAVGDYYLRILVLNRHVK
jgi:hypothetical protein